MIFPLVHRTKGSFARRGIGLVELIVTIAIMSFVILGATQIFIEGSRLFQTNLRAAEAQNSATKLLSRVNFEVVNANSDACRIYGDSSLEGVLPGLPGIVFASPVTNEGRVQFNSWDGRIRWQRYICFYYDPSTRSVFRKEEAIPMGALPSGITSPELTGNSDLAQVIAGMKSTDDFHAASSAEKRLLANDVARFEFSEFVVGEGIVPGTASSDTRAHLSYNVTLEVGDKSVPSMNSYFIRIESRVTPRS